MRKEETTIIWTLQGCVCGYVWVCVCVSAVIHFSFNRRNRGCAANFAAASAAAVAAAVVVVVAVAAAAAVVAAAVETAAATAAAAGWLERPCRRVCTSRSQCWTSPNRPAEFEPRPWRPSGPRSARNHPTPSPVSIQIVSKANQMSEETSTSVPARRILGKARWKRAAVGKEGPASDGPWPFWL